MFSSISSKKKQSGAALLAFVLIILAGSAYLLTKKFNTNSSRYKSDQITNDSLNLAKVALIGWSLSHPDNPGMLLFPDRNGDANYDGNSDCTTGTVNNNLLLGRLPWYGQGSPCISPQTGLNLIVKDYYDEELWYAVSKNLVYESPNYPFVSPALLNKTTDWITVRDSNGNVISDRVAFVVISPGRALDGQDRSASAPAITNYLDNVTIAATGTPYSNADYDQDFIIYPNSETTDDVTDHFNDQLVYVTIDEFIESIEKRAMNELGNLLTSYHSSNSAFPWLSAYADPKVNKPNIYGTADSGSSSSLLIDSNKDFVELGVKQNDLIYNITDGSIGIVSANPVQTDRVSVSNMVLGSENDFDQNDEYYVLRKETQSVLSGTMTSTTSSSTVLSDSSKDFTETEVDIGDILENITDGSAGVIVSITTNDLEVASLTGGTDNNFDNGDSYLIKSNFGIATNASESLTTLQDSDKDFTNMGVQVGDLIWNTTDESIGRITTVSTNSLTVDQLYFGTDNKFEANDTYIIPKFNTVTDTRKGQLAFHEVGELFATDLDLDWSITVNSGDIAFDSGAFSNANSTYTDAFENYVKQYSSSGTASFTSNDNISNCIWSVAEVADCFGTFKDFVNVSGNLTSHYGYNGNRYRIIDSSADFDDIDGDGIKRGDIAQNYDDEDYQTSGTVDAANSGTATADTDADGYTLEDTDNDFTKINMSIGDTIYNLTDGSKGTVTGFSTDQITVDELTDGTNNIFSSGDDYQIGDEPIFYDAAASPAFSSYERYSYLVQNQTLESELSESKIQGIVADVFDDYTLEAEAYDGEGTEDIQFRPNDAYRIYKPKQFVVESRMSSTTVQVDNYLDGTNPDFDTGERYRIMPASKSFSSSVETVNNTGSTDRFTDSDGDFINKGVEKGDIIENHANGFGEITDVTATQITTQLRGGWNNNFSTSNSFTIYYDYVFSRRHDWHVRIRGNDETKTSSNIRRRDVCIGYDSSCSSTSATTFSDNNNATLLTVRDFQEDETTEVGRTVFTPSSSSSGSIKVSNIEYLLSEAAGDLPAWFIRNKWYQYFYIAYSSGGDIPTDNSACTAGTDCLELNITGLSSNQDNIRAIIVYSGEELSNQLTLRSAGSISAYFESENADEDNSPGETQLFDKLDENFNPSGDPIDFNDKIRAAITCPAPSTEICWE